MNKLALLAFVFAASTLYSKAQDSSSSLPEAPRPIVTTSPMLRYEPPTQKERFSHYMMGTYGPLPVAEAAVRGAIQYKRDRPEGWPQDGQGYLDRFGSAMGEIAVRGTTQYVLSNLFREDIRVIPCRCSESKFVAALADTFTARKSEDGHRAFSVARIVGPISGSVVAYKTWYPSSTPRSEMWSEVGLNYGFVFVSNLIRETFHHN